jgi:hypothetical protein
VPLTVLAPSSTPAMALAATVMAELRLSSARLGADGDAVLADMILSASDAIQRYTGRVFAAARYQELLPGNDAGQLLLARTPLIAIETVLFNTDPLLDVTIADADAGLIYRERGFGWTGTYAWGTLSDTRMVGSERPLYAITYRAGYRMHDDDPADPLAPRPSDGALPLPYDLRRACVETVKAYWEGKSGVLIRSQSVADLSVTYGDVPQGDLPAAVKALLIPWRRAV